MSERKNISRNANRPTKDRGAYIQGITSSGAKSEAKEIEEMKKLEEWKQL